VSLVKTIAKNEMIAQERFLSLGLDSLKKKKPLVVSVIPRYCPIQGFKVYISQEYRDDNFGVWVSGETAVKWGASTMTILRKYLVRQNLFRIRTRS
jgi:hypothetical protein